MHAARLKFDTFLASASELSRTDGRMHAAADSTIHNHHAAVETEHIVGSFFPATRLHTAAATLTIVLTARSLYTAERIQRQ